MTDSINPRAYRREDEDAEQALVERRRVRYHRDPLQTAQMKARMAALYTEGMYLDDIAIQVSEEFGLEQPIQGKTVSFHIQNMIKYWQQTGLLAIDLKMAMQLARIDQVEMLAVNAYFKSMEGVRVTNFKKQVRMARSKKNEEEVAERVKEERDYAAEFDEFEEVKNKQQVGALPQLLQVTAQDIENHSKTTESEAGDPRWLRVMLDCIDMRNKMWGLYIKDKDMANPDQELARLTEEERDQRLAAVLTNVAQRVAGKQAAQGLLAPPMPLGGLPIPTDDEEIENEDGTP